MTIQIDENILLAAAGLIFVPLFIFFIKLIIQMSAIQGKIDNINDTIKEHKESINELNNVLYEIRMVKLRIDNVEQRESGHKGGPNI